MVDAREVAVPPARVNTITLFDREISVEGADTIVIVGANNSGKSLFLRELDIALSDPSTCSRHMIVGPQAPGVHISDNLAGWLTYNRPHAEVDGRDHVFTRNQVLALDAIDGAVSTARHSGALGALHEHLVKYLDTTSRLANHGWPQRRAISSKEPLSTPIELVAYEEKRRAELQAVVEDTFGVQLVVDGLGASIILRVAPADFKLPAEVIDQETHVPLRSAVDVLMAQPELNAQGDGIRAFLNVYLEAFASIHPLLLIDEPEAFLHPATAYSLGRRLSSNETQAFISTHSSDILRGILSTNPNRTTIIRIDREDNGRIHQLDLQLVKELIGDPFLRHSNALDGLFHDAVVVCEGDIDAAFLRAVLDELPKNYTHLRGKDVLFIPCGDKRRAYKVVKALSAVSVPVLVVFDFDVLNMEEPLAKSLQAKGDVDDAFVAEALKLRKVVDSEIRQQGAEKKAGSILDELANLVGEDRDRHLNTTERSRMMGVIRKSTKWGEVKSQGLSRVPAGEAHKAATRLVELLSSKGIHLVPTGEIESFDRSAGRSSKQAWLVEALERESHRTSAAQNFLVSVLESQWPAES